MTDLTFASGTRASCPVAKAYSGLTDEEIDQLDRWNRQHTLERFGPVPRSSPVHVFELHFEGIAESTRHAAGGGALSAHRPLAHRQEACRRGHAPDIALADQSPALVALPINAEHAGWSLNSPCSCWMITIVDRIR